MTMWCYNPNHVVPASRIVVKFVPAPCSGLRYSLLVLPTPISVIVSVFILVRVGVVLEDDHSPMGGSDDVNVRLIG